MLVCAAASSPLKSLGNNMGGARKMSPRPTPVPGRTIPENAATFSQETYYVTSRIVKPTYNPMLSIVRVDPMYTSHLHSRRWLLLE